MSIHNSQQNESNTQRGTKNRNTMMDLYDHGPILGILNGQWAKLHNVSMEINSNTEMLTTISGESKPYTTSKEIVFKFMVDRDTAYNVMQLSNSDSVYILTKKHDIELVRPRIDVRADEFLTNDLRHIEIACDDYIVKHDWHPEL